MIKAIFIWILLCLAIGHKGLSQSSPNLPYRSPSEYKMEWQRLHLQLSSAYFMVARENQFDFESSLLHVSRSLGLSHNAVIAEGINDKDLPVSWVDEKNPGKAVNLLSGLNGKQHLEQLILLGAYYDFQPNSYHRYKG